MKTFKDLKFEPHPISTYGIKPYSNAKQAIETFENGYGVSVLFGNCFYSNGKNSYELAILLNGELCYNTEITGDVLGYLSKDEVSEVMLKVAML